MSGGEYSNNTHFSGIIIIQIKELSFYLLNYNNIFHQLPGKAWVNVFVLDFKSVSNWPPK